jgi:hypothetical protein
MWGEWSDEAVITPWDIRSNEAACMMLLNVIRIKCSLLACRQPPVLAERQFYTFANTVTTSVPSTYFGLCLKSVLLY